MVTSLNKIYTPEELAVITKEREQVALKRSDTFNRLVKAMRREFDPSSVKKEAVIDAVSGKVIKGETVDEVVASALQDKVFTQDYIDKIKFHFKERRRYSDADNVRLLQVKASIGNVVQKNSPLELEKVARAFGSIKLNSTDKPSPTPSVKTARSFTQISEPTLAQLATNFDVAVKPWADAGYKVVSKAYYEKISKACDVCPEGNWHPTERGGRGRCKKAVYCCSFRWTRFLVSAQCPIKKWPPRE